MRDNYGAHDERSWLLRFHTQTAGCSLTAQQVENNVARTALEALAAVLGGTQSLHTNAMDEVLALPTAKAAQIALRTQQIIAFETGVTATIDPLGGSYFVEDLTNRMEMEAEAYFTEIDARGGVLACIESGFFQSEIADAAFRYQEQLDRGERIVVGVNAFTSDDGDAPPLLHIDGAVETDQIARLRKVRSERDGEAVGNRLEELRLAAEGTENLMPRIIDAVRALCTEGEITSTLAGVFGGYREPAVF
jgi:methylmalonyl-CoA mutase N-terminal domain/subunit